MSETVIVRYWKGRSGISPRFGLVYPGRRLTMDKKTAEKFKADLQKEPINKAPAPEEPTKKKSRTKR